MGVKLSKLIYNQGFKYDQSLHWITKLGDLSKYVTEVIKKLGYDGVIYGSEYVVFYPNYIKSVDNDGSWDIDDEDMDEVEKLIQLKDKFDKKSFTSFVSEDIDIDSKIDAIMI
jgi:hypothetical protein